MPSTERLQGFPLGLGRAAGAQSALEIAVDVGRLRPRARLGRMHNGSSARWRLAQSERASWMDGID